MNTDLHRYLKCATAFLLPAQRQRVRSELHGNLHQVMLDGQLTGLNEAEAWAAALNQAGPAWLLAVNLARIHTLPSVARVLLVGVALGGAAYAVQSSAHSHSAVQQAQP